MDRTAGVGELDVGCEVESGDSLGEEVEGMEVEDSVWGECGVADGVFDGEVV